MECEKAMIGSAVICLPNFLGNLFNTAHIRLEGSELILRVNGQDRRLSLSDIKAFPQLRKGWFGGTYRFDACNQSFVLRFLSRKTLPALESAVRGAITELADTRIQSIYQQFETAAVRQYLRDSRVSDLDEDISSLLSQYKPLLAESGCLSAKRLQQLNVLSAVQPLSSTANEIRRRFAQKQMSSRKRFFDRVESNPLTEQQRLAVIRNNDRNLVLAAAGTGKTSVIVAKALDLIDTAKAEPKSILILAYNNAAAKELRERLEYRAEQMHIQHDRLPEIQTFHALGRRILIDTGITPSLSRFAEDRLALESWATSWFEQALQRSERSLKMFIRLLYPAINPFDFKTVQEYEEYVRDNEYRTLKGEQVRGYQELLIANWLYLHSVDYEYEPSYVSKRRISAGFDYRPDFHITGTDIYLEHFGIDRAGNTRPGIDNVKFQNEMVSKRNLHTEVGTTLLETFHHNWVEGTLEDVLEQQLTDAGIKLHKRPLDEVLDALKDFGGIAEGVARYLKCLQAIRVEQLSGDDIFSRLNAHNIANADEYTDLLSAFHNAYKDKLLEEERIDFDDMIIRATTSVLTGTYRSHYSHILVDEFQDISRARMDFLNAMIEKGPDPILTVVGDDWQSIYRFSGGKLELTTRFEEHVGSHSLTRLEKTFRYNNSIAHTAGMFVMANPEQYKKEISTHQIVASPQVYLLDDLIDGKPDLQETTRQIVSKILQHSPDASIAVMARYNYLLQDARDYLDEMCRNSNITFWTFHGSKGLEADHCIIIGLSQGKLGFPNSRKDELVVEALLPSLDPYLHSEERRLFYVAITRAKQKCYLVADAAAPSFFVEELLSPSFEVNIVSERFSEKYRRLHKCPSCTSGYFKKQSGQFGEFYACSSGNACPTKVRICEFCNSPSVDTQTHSVCNNEDCASKLPICPLCGRPLHERAGKYGKFYGCSGYGIPDDRCSYTQTMNERHQ